MAGLQSLPDELLVQICTHLDQYELSNASLTCKRLYDASVDILYDTPHCQRLGDNGSHASLLQAIASQPHLAKRVRHLSINYVSVRYDQRLPASQAYKIAKLASVFEPTLKKSRCWDLAMAHSKIYSDELIFGLLLYYATHVESLMLGPDCFPSGFSNEEWPWASDPDGAFHFRNERNTRLLSVMLLLAARLTREDGSRPFEKLRTVIFTSYLGEDDDCEHQTEVATWRQECWPILFSVPTLETFFMQGLCNVTFDWIVPPRTSNVVNISLLDCDLPTEFVRDLLRSCKALRVFHWNTADSRHHRRETNYKILAPELLRFASTLKSLGLYSSCKVPEEGIRPFSHARSSCLGDWSSLFDILPSLSNLKNLKMDQGGDGLSSLPIPCHRNLPPNLETLSYTLDALNSGHPLDRTVESVVEACYGIAGLRLEILVTREPSEAGLVALRARHPHLLFAHNPTRRRVPPWDGHIAPSGLLEVISDYSRVTEPDFHQDCFEKAHAPYESYESGTPRSRPYKCIADDQGRCRCTAWEEREYPGRPG